MVDQYRESVPEWLDREAFPFESRFLQTRFGRVHYVDEGPREGEVVLLVHGTPSWSFEYRHLIPVLARTRRVIAVDHLGFGLSERPADFPYTPEAHTEVLREVIDRLRLTRFALAVHDYGGPIALPIAVAEPERISSLVLMNTWFWRLETDREFRAWRALRPPSWDGFCIAGSTRRCGCLCPARTRIAGSSRRASTRQYLAPFPLRADRVRVLWTLARSLRHLEPELRRFGTGVARLGSIPSLVVWGSGRPRSANRTCSSACARRCPTPASRRCQASVIGRKKKRRTSVARLLRRLFAALAGCSR